MKNDITESVVETSGLTRMFGKLKAVDSLNLKVKRGEVYGLLGPNGSGKTTAIKMLCGLIKPTSGEALILDKKPGSSSIKSRVG